jgi:hypothetical protein
MKKKLIVMERKKNEGFTLNNSMKQEMFELKN